MKIKDLSLSNNVTGEGLLHWKIEDISGQIITFDLPGYHIPKAKVRLLSPQVLLSTYGGHTKQTTRKVEVVCLADGVILNAHLCPKSCLLLLLFVPTDQDLPSFWTESFSYSTNDISAIKTILSLANMNLSSAQKKMLLWHQRLSHANMAWIKTLMQDHKWLEDKNSMASLHSGQPPLAMSKE
jgi:hypothetical protein